MITIAILSIALLAIAFFMMIVALMRRLIESIRDESFVEACIYGLSIIAVCIFALLLFSALCSRTNQIVCTDYQVEERVDSFGNTTFVITYER